MEFADLKLLSSARSSASAILPFSELRESPTVLMTQEMELVQSQENLAIVKSLLEKNAAVARVLRSPPEQSFLDRDDFPRRVLLEMTSKCNVLCRMCPRNDFHRPEMDMDVDAYCRILDELNEHGVEGVWTYHLGESLMHPDFRKIIRHTERLNNIRKVWMSTNGHLMNQSNLDFIFDSRIDYINFSLHAISEKSYKSVVPYGDFSQVLKNYEYLVKMKQGNRLKAPFVHLQMIEQEATKHETTAFIDAHYREVEIVSVNMLEYSNLKKNAYGLGQRERGGRGHCIRVSRNDAYVCSNGAVTLCPVAYDCDKHTVGDLYLGNIHEQSLSEIWNGPRRKKLLGLERAGQMDEIKLCSTCTDHDI